MAFIINYLLLLFFGGYTGSGFNECAAVSSHLSMFSVRSFWGLRIMLKTPIVNIMNCFTRALNIKYIPEGVKVWVTVSDSVRVSGVSVSVKVNVRVSPSGSVGVGFSANANIRESFDINSVIVLVVLECVCFHQGF